jgi:hypothetical protein
MYKLAYGEIVSMLKNSLTKPAIITTLKALLVVSSIVWGGFILPVTELPANWRAQGWQAEAKKKKLTAAMVKKELLALQPEIIRLLSKSRSRGLFTPEDSDKVNEIRETLNLLIGGSPKSEELVEPAYQAGQLFLARELYFDSYEAFSFIEAQFPKSAYATKAMYQKKVVLRKMPAEDREALEAEATTTPATPATVATTEKPATKK